MSALRGAPPVAVVDPWSVDATGWCPAAQRQPSPNCDARPPGVAPDLLVIHNISLPPAQYGGREVVDLFLNRLDFAAHPYFADLKGVRVSAHFFVRRDGTLVQFVPCDARAWHAGVSRFGTRSACNDFSIGVELEGCDAQAFEGCQYATLAKLARALCAHYPLSDVAGHSEIAPGRKTDPGPHFNWQRFLAEAAVPLRHGASAL